MFIAFLVVIVASAIFWLVFLKLRLVRLTPGWGLIFGFFVLHLLLVFVIGLRFVTPNSSNATVVQRTIQLIPRLPEPTLVTEVLVEENVPVKKGQPLFQFDRRPYEYKVAQISAQLAEAKQNVKILKREHRHRDPKDGQDQGRAGLRALPEGHIRQARSRRRGARGGRREVGNPRQHRASDE